LSKRGVALNGRFLSVPASGVQRVAEELIKHLDRLIAERSPAGDWVLFTPCDADRDLDLTHINTVRSKRRRGQRWEQFELAHQAGGRFLVNLCNQAPLFDQGGAVMIHDAQAFIAPQSYSWAFRTWYRFSLPRICRRAKVVLTVSHYSREKLIEYGVASGDKVIVIHNGVDHVASVSADASCLARLELAPQSYVVALANTQPHKNVSVLFDAFAHLKRLPLKLVLVGSAGREAFAKIGLLPPENTVFAGKVSDGELRALYENAVCIAFPSTTEGFGLPPLEAMFVGCPAVVAPCGALPEVCGDAALYVAPDDGEGWAKAIADLATDNVLRDGLAGAGRNRAAQFTWDVSARRLLEVISEAL
jgi:glycosyltransferase involved in cell wall biosynthesis